MIQLSQAATRWQAGIIGLGGFTPGPRRERRTHNHLRHGITSLFAAFDIADM